MSSKPWVGCSCAPSPALITLDFNRCARNCGAPAELWRNTRISACNASRFRAVSLSVSPFVRLEVVAEMLITSALNRNAASSNDVRVRVLGSTKKFTSVFPRRAGTFLISRVPTCLNASAVSRMKLISPTDNSRRPSRSLRLQRVLMKFAFAFSFFDKPNAVRLVGAADLYPHFFIRCRRQIFSDVIGANWQLAMPTIDQRGELNPGRPPKRIDRVHRRARGATSIENVIDNDDRAPFQRDW